MLFIQTKVFDPELGGKAIQLAGDSLEGEVLDGLYLVRGVDGQYIRLINRFGKEFNLHLDNFEHREGLKLQILELPQQQAIKIPDKVAVMETLPEIEFVEPEKKHKTGFKRNQGSRNIRSYLQIKVDNSHVEWILQQNIEPLKLEEILKRMQNDHGHWHWSNSNASGFVKRAIKDGKRIKQIGYGCYGYDWEAAK